MLEIEDYMEDLLALTGKLSKRYTSYESSSVTYEAAAALMGGAVYCVEEYLNSAGEAALTAGKKQNIEQAYQEGQRLVTEKVYQAKEVYEQLLDGFLDYGCRNYHETFIKGMPQFFLRYDAVFCPQEHLLTLDYPVIGQKQLMPLSGVNLILGYLTCALEEKNLLLTFDASGIRQLLEETMVDYQELYMDNICSLVLWQAVKCVIAHKPPHCLVLDKEDKEAVKLIFKGNSRKQAELTIRHSMQPLVRSVTDETKQQYFTALAREFAVYAVMESETGIQEV